MNARESLKTFAGSVVVYGVIAACGASNHSEGGPSAGIGGQAAMATGGATMAMVSGGANGTAGVVTASGASGSSEASGGVASTGGAKSSGGMMSQMMNPVPPAHADPTSGSRLRAKYVTGSDGSKQFWGWHDNQRNEDCTFRAAADGMMRCLPSPTGSTGVYFADAGCMNPVVLATKGQGCSVPKYVSSGTNTGCNYAPSLLSVGPLLAAVSLYQGAPGSCTSVPSASLTALAASLDFYSAGAAIEPSAFVAGTTSVE